MTTVLDLSTRTFFMSARSTQQFALGISGSVGILDIIGRSARLLFKQGGPSPTILMSKAFLVFSDLNLP